MVFLIDSKNQPGAVEQTEGLGGGIEKCAGSWPARTHRKDFSAGFSSRKNIEVNRPDIEQSLVIYVLIELRSFAGD